MQQIQATIGQDYTIQIPPNTQGFSPGAKVAVLLKASDKVSKKKEPLDWIQKTRGIAKKAWKDIDTTQYLEDLRNGWNKKP